jgi:hypothetical protein
MTRHLTALATLALTGCAAITYSTETLHPPTRAIEALAVYPVTLAFPHQPYEEYEKTQNIISELRALGVVTVGPEEFEVRDFAAAPQHGSSLASQATALGIHGARVAVLRVRALREEINAWALLRDNHGRREGYLHLWQARYALTLELVRLDGTVLARTQGEACEQRDDLAAADASEKYPKLRDALATMTRDLLTRTEPGLMIARAPAHPDLDVVDLHQRLLRQPEVALALRTLDLIERDVRELVRYRYFYPDFPAGLLPTVRRTGDGVLVTRSRGAARAAGLRPGDVVVEVDGQRLRGQSHFTRALLGHPRELAVWRGEGRVRVALATETPVSVAARRGLAPTVAFAPVAAPALALSAPSALGQ